MEKKEIKRYKKEKEISSKREVQVQEPHLPHTLTAGLSSSKLVWGWFGAVPRS
jgi:hypothetical protein